MKYLFYGDNSFTIREAISSMKEDVGAPDLRDVNVSTFEASELSFDQLVATCSTVPFMADRRLVIVRDLASGFERGPSTRGRSRPAADGESSLGKWEGLAEYLPTVPETTDLVFVDGRLSRNNPLLRRIGPHVTTRSFPLPRGTELRDWVRSRASSKEMAIEPMAVNLLAETVGGDLDTLDSELEKLAAYRMGAPVREEDVEELVSYAREANIFATVDAVIEGRAGPAIRLARRLLESGDPPSHLLSMLARQVRLLLLTKELKAERVGASELGARLKLSDYPLRKTLEQESRFTSDHLVQAHRRLLEADVSIKSGAVPEDLAVELLIADLCSVVRGGQRAAGPRRG